MKPIRLLIHWPHFPGYVAACVAELRRRHPVDTLVLYNRVETNAPYARQQYQGVGEVCDITGSSQAGLDELIREFHPSAAIVGGWMPQAQRLARSAKALEIPVVACSDNLFRGKLRQRLFPLYRRLFLRRLHDYYWVPGQKAKEYLVWAGVKPSSIWPGLYAPDIFRFQTVASLRGTAPKSTRPAFLFLGQYISRKGLPELLTAFEAASVGDWRLILCGSGPLKGLVARHAARLGRIEDRGFLQPPELPQVMAEATVFVLPSRHDAWPLVIGEAAAAGLPVVCSDACGCAVELVREGDNGFTCPPNSVPALKSALERMASLADAQLEAMGQKSRELVAPYSPSNWAAFLFGKLCRVVQNKNRAR